MFPSLSVSVVTQVPAVFCHTGYCLSLYPHLSSPQRMEIMGGGMVLWRGPRVHAKDWYVDLQRLDTVNTPPEPHHRGRPAKLTWRKIQLAFFSRPQQIQARAQQLKWHRQGFISHTHIHYLPFIRETLLPPAALLTFAVTSDVLLFLKPADHHIYFCSTTVISLDTSHAKNTRLSTRLFLEGKHH